MVIRVTFKDPDWDQDCVLDAAREEVLRQAPGITDEGEREALVEIKCEKIRAALRPYLKFGEYLTVEFEIGGDGKVGRATVVEKE
jgi:hypothetical protein